jgi:hypothetical protein
MAGALWTVAMHPEKAEFVRPDPAETEIKGTEHTRVLWIIFDELDQRALFEDLPAWVSVPAFMAFSEQSFQATQAISAAPDTVTAVPSLTLGRPVATVRSADADRLMLRFPDRPDEEVDWKSLPNLFSGMREDNARIGIVGWYHPYCRLFGKLTSRCRRIYFGMSQIVESPPLGKAVWEKIASLSPLYRRRNAIAAIQRGLAEAKDYATDRNLDFVYVHLPLPHKPTVFDVSTGAYTVWNFDRDGYFHNLVAADDLFGKIRTAMEQAELWDETAVIVTPDHSWRGSRVGAGHERDTRVPFLIKLPGQNTKEKFDYPFSATVVKDLILALRRGEIATPEDIEAWLHLNNAGMVAPSKTGGK